MNIHQLTHCVLNILIFVIILTFLLFYLFFLKSNKNIFTFIHYCLINIDTYYFTLIYFFKQIKEYSNIFHYFFIFKT